jgi:hypothetical protein
MQSPVVPNKFPPSVSLIPRMTLHPAPVGGWKVPNNLLGNPQNNAKPVFIRKPYPIAVLGK